VDFSLRNLQRGSGLARPLSFSSSRASGAASAAKAIARTPVRYPVGSNVPQAQSVNGRRLAAAAARPASGARINIKL